MFAESVGTDAHRSLVVCSDKQAEIAKRRSDGESLATISRATGLGIGVLRRIVKELALPPRPRCPVSGPHERTILTMHDEGKGIKEISTALNLEFVTVYRVLQRNGKLRKKTRKRP
jgi:hypothetical protein